MNYVLLESLRPADKDLMNLRIASPDTVLQTTSPSEVVSVLKEVERAVSGGYTAAGFLSYEAGLAFVPNMAERKRSDFPLIWFALTKTPDRLPAGKLPNEMETTNSARVRDLVLSETPESYENSIHKIKHYIETGYTYQVNYTMRYRGLLEGSARGLYRNLRSQQRVNYAAFIETDEWAVLSLSPELFFRTEGRNVMMKPMKGTAPRGKTREEEQLLARALQENEKERSENLMIVDLLRNDLGKVCETGSIRVELPMEVERYETLLQMTSTITGRLNEEGSITDLLRATFPSGSITGAPKLSTMRIIEELEPSRRNIYTGSIGFIAPGVSVFNVAIRTAFVDLKTSAIEMGVGSGILYEAVPLREYRECELKGKFLTEPSQSFQLLETILWNPKEGYPLLPLHMDRLMNSADYFLFSADRQSIESALRAKESELLKQKDSKRIRLLVDDAGHVEVEIGSLEEIHETPLKVRLSVQRTDSGDRFLYHKTTARSLYDSEWQRARNEGYFDVLFQNERDEITEGAITNVFIKKDGVYYTPPLSSGVLAGTYRKHLMETRPFPIQERVLYVEDLERADEIYLTNALRGMIRVILQ